MFLVFVASQITFWTSNWIEFHTGMLQTSVGNFGVTEAEIICMLIHLLTGIFGQGMWGISLDFLLPQSLTSGLYSSFPVLEKLLTFKAKQVVAYSLGCILILLALVSFAKALRGNKTSKTHMLLEWLGVILMVTMEFIWMHLPIYDTYNGIILVNFGIITSLIVCKVIVSSVTKVPSRLLR